jgi:uncharacterized protein (DUF2141 family)
MWWRCASLVAVVLCGGEADPRSTTAPAASLGVSVTDLRNTKGHLRLGVFDQAKGFPRDREAAMLWKTMPADSREKTFALELPPGRYAVVILHDENGNKKLDENFLGVPKEGYGVSNNPKPRFRAATFEEATFELDDSGAALTISIQYF